MQFSQETDYALRLVDFFSRSDRETYHNARELSTNLSIPYRFLLRVLGKLKRGGILASRQGDGGGYRLGRPPGEITLRQVVSLTESHASLSRCLGDTGLCNAGVAPNCRVHRTLCRVQEQMDALLDTYTFGNMGD